MPHSGQVKVVWVGWVMMTLHSGVVVVSRESTVVDPSSRGVPTADPYSLHESSKLVTLDSSGVFGRIFLLRHSINDQ